MNHATKSQFKIGLAILLLAIIVGLVNEYKGHAKASDEREVRGVAVKRCFTNYSEAYNTFIKLAENDRKNLWMLIEDEAAEQSIIDRLSEFREVRMEFIPENEKGEFGFKEEKSLKVFATAINRSDTVWVTLRDHDKEGCFKVVSMKF